MEVLTAILNFLTAALTSPDTFVVFSTFANGIMLIAVYALWVSHMNKAIMLKRKELGMNEVDQAIQAVREKMISHYYKIARERLGEDFFNRKETAIYKYLVAEALGERKPVYRSRIRRNHFNEKSSGEWTRYVHDCMDDDIRTITEFLDVHYHPQAKIPRSPDLYEWNQEIMSDIRHIIEDLFAQLLHIAENNKLRKFFGYKLEIGLSLIHI